MRSFLALILVAAALAGCQSPEPPATIGVDTYYVSGEDRIHHDVDGAAHVVTCTGGKHVHLLMVRGASAWPQRSGWRIHADGETTAAVEVDQWTGTLGVYGCLPDGVVATAVSYEEGRDVVAYGRVGVDPLVTRS